MNFYGTDGSESSIPGGPASGSSVSTFIPRVFSSPPAPASGPPEPEFCDDYTACCGPALGHASCNGGTHEWCEVALYNSTARHGGQHPLLTCAHCQQHHTLSKQFEVERLYAPHHPHWGFRAQLCGKCTLDEVQLYWKRVGLQNPPTAGDGRPLARPNTQQSMNYIHEWPQWRAGAVTIQNLCTCRLDCIDDNRNHHSLNPGIRCHGCRDALFQERARRPRDETEDVLKTKYPNTINGTKRPRTRPIGTHRGPAGSILGRNHALQCPCGKDVVQPRNPDITICLACMGVRIVGANLPAGLQQDSLRQGRDRLRIREHTQKHRARRGADTRVNIERAWLDDDDLIGFRT